MLFAFCMKRRAGASETVAVESVRHLCEAAEQVTSGAVRVIHKDGRFLTVGGDDLALEDQADVVVFEVRLRMSLHI